MKKLVFPIAIASFLLAAANTAQITTDSITIGGPGSCSNSGFCNPALLNDGVTAASATYEFTLDVGANTLEVVVTNTSPVVVGVPNPLLTVVFFNLPSQVTAASLTNQTSSGGVTPAYALTFDADLATNPNPNGAGSFGAFSVALSDSGNIQGTIANPNADTYTVLASQLAISPVTFTLSLTGNLAGLTAESITALLSVIPPGNNPSHAAARFQGAGAGGQASDFVNDGDVCPTPASVMTLGSPCGGTLSVSPPVPLGWSTTTYNGSIPNAQAVVLFSQPGGTTFPFKGCTIFLRSPTQIGKTTMTDANGDFQYSHFIGTTHLCTEQLVIQVIVKDPINPGVWEVSNGVLVTMGS